ncbi:hypothetical protein B0H15DRAFT_800136 [Mycena belliarum]|uniref:Uncharacterized protein n=1 Tax=Mycena belliarum TaxID=1033014 RepID=A0AAD6UAE9_9AGAR|nr:hypothetical protein B0H15DRAFT_800129 [Mycena belliae]KAJ7090908.1 hypothetical protein B0H15DRAFT_800136 [Mycena belliae]
MHELHVVPVARLSPLTFVLLSAIWAGCTVTKNTLNCTSMTIALNGHRTAVPTTPIAHTSSVASATEEWANPPPINAFVQANGPARNRPAPQIGRGPPPPGFAPVNRSASLNMLAQQPITRDYRYRSANFPPTRDDTNPGHHYPAEGPIDPMRSEGPPPGGSGQDQLAAMVESLTLENRALKAQLSAATSAPSAPAPAVRGQLSSRAKVVKSRGHRYQQSIAATTDGSDSESDTPTSRTPAVYLTKANCTTKPLKDARSALQTFVTKSMRDVCGVGPNDRWADPDERRVNEVTGETYLTPYFEGDVKDPRNVPLFDAVIDRAYNDLQNRDNMPRAVRDVNGTCDKPLLEEMTKNAFRNLKPGWKAQVDEDAKTRDHVKRQINRRLQRRVTKVKQRRGAVPTFAEKYHLDANAVAELIYEEHMSDELSAPDSDDEVYQSRETWKKEMARLIGHLNSTNAALQGLEILEVITPDWRSHKLSALFHALHEIALKTPVKDKYKRVRNTGRRCRRVPAASPYDFGIADGWLENAREDPERAPLLETWGTFGNPPGFEALNAALNSVAAAAPLGDMEGGSASALGLVSDNLDAFMTLADPQFAIST